MKAKKKKSGASPVTSATADRNYLLSTEQVAKLREEWKADGAKKSRPVNPYRGCFRAIVATLIELGVNKPHPFTAVKREIKRLMSAADTRVGDETAWERFAGKEARNEETAKDVDGRIRQNIDTLQRHKNYGAKLIQIGTEVLGTAGMTIDVLAGDTFRLNTDSDTPERSHVRKPKPENAKVTPAARKPSSNAKPKAKASKTSKPKPKAKGKGKAKAEAPKSEAPTGEAPKQEPPAQV